MPKKTSQTTMTAKAEKTLQAAWAGVVKESAKEAANLKKQIEKAKKAIAKAAATVKTSKNKWIAAKKRASKAKTAAAEKQATAAKKTFVQAQKTADTLKAQCAAAMDVFKTVNLAAKKHAALAREAEKAEAAWDKAWRLQCAKAEKAARARAKTAKAAKKAAKVKTTKTAKVVTTEPEEAVTLDADALAA